MPVPKFPVKVLDQAIKIRRGTLVLTDIPEKERPAVQDAMRRDTVLMTHLRLQRPVSHAVDQKPHIRGV